ncbi:hypothetical protein P9112_011168 [Eukaryota sp. TZLM1-RC]
MRMRCFLWPCSLPNDLICRCKSVVTLSHILNCKYFITYRSIVHDSVRDQLYAMCKSFNIEAFIEPLVRKLSSDQTEDSFGKRRADLVAPGIDGVLNVVDVVSVDVCKNSAARLVYSADSPLSNAEKKKIKKCEEPLAQLGRVEHVKYQFVLVALFENFKKVLLNRSGKTMNSTFWFPIAFPFSINGRLSVEAEIFLDDFQKMVQEKSMKRFDIFLWRSRIQFAIINRLPRCFSRIREALARQQANQDFVDEILVQ